MVGADACLRGDGAVVGEYLRCAGAPGVRPEWRRDVLCELFARHGRSVHERDTVSGGTGGGKIGEARRGWFQGDEKLPNRATMQTIPGPETGCIEKENLV